MILSIISNSNQTFSFQPNNPFDSTHENVLRSITMTHKYKKSSFIPFLMLFIIQKISIQFIVVQRPLAFHSQFIITFFFIFISKHITFLYDYSECEFSFSTYSSTRHSHNIRTFLKFFFFRNFP